MSDVKIKRREFVKRAAYAAPVILTLKAMPAFAAAGSSNNKPRSSRGGSSGGGTKGDPSDKTAPKEPKGS
jgi:hypothetical protein